MWMCTARPDSVDTNAVLNATNDRLHNTRPPLYETYRLFINISQYINIFLNAILLNRSEIGHCSSHCRQVIVQP